MPCLVPGEIEFNKVQKLLDFDQGNLDSIPIEILQLNLKIESESLQKIKEHSLRLEKDLEKQMENLQ